MRIVGDIYGETLRLTRDELGLIVIALEYYWRNRPDDPFRDEYKALAGLVRTLLGEDSAAK